MSARKNRRILVIVRGHIGDLIQATPALRALRRHFPDAHLAVLVNEYARAVLDGCPFVDEVIDGFAYEARTRTQRLRDGASLARKLFRHFDTVIGLRYSPKQWPALAFAIGARTRAGFDQPNPWGRLLTHRAGKPPADLPNRMRNLLPLEALGVEGAPEYEPLDWGGAAVTASTEEVLASVGVEVGQPYAVLQVSCNWGCNELRSDKWAEIADGLTTRHGLRTVVVGVEDPFELAKYEEICELAAHPPASLHGRTTLPQLFELVRRAALVVATDSALTQVALAQATPSVILFGIEPTRPNGPLPSERHLMDIVQHWEGPGLAPTPNPNCRFFASYCHTEHCRENSSLARTTATEVLDHVATVLGRERSAASEPATG